MQMFLPSSPYLAACFSFSHCKAGIFHFDLHPERFVSACLSFSVPTSPVPLQMGLTEEIIAIIELCVYIPIFPLALVVVFRHGWRRQLGWIYLAIFCLIRIVGAGFKVASTRNPANSTDLERSAILQSIGLSPLLLASMGLLKRM